MTDTLEQVEAMNAGQLVFDDPDADQEFVPADRQAARWAVTALADAFASAPGTVRRLVETAKAGASNLSGDRLQGLSEIVQNADDAGATQVEFRLGQNELVVVHNGQPAQLRHIHALASPWLTTKADDANATGRFGVGLSTLQSLSDEFEMHSGPYSVRYGEPLLAAIDKPSDFLGPAMESDTIFRIPFRSPVLTESEFLEWANRWDHSGLMFLKSVRRVEFRLARSEANEVKLGLKAEDSVEFSSMIHGHIAQVSRSKVSAPDGRIWMRYESDLPSPSGLTRAHKRTSKVTRLQIALPLENQSEPGTMYAGLPVETLPAPMLANGQFDPIASRQELASNDWNAALGDYLGDLWQASILDLFHIAPQSAWGCVPLDLGEGQEATPFMTELCDRVHRAAISLGEALDLWVGSDLHKATDLAAEHRLLEEFVTASDIEHLVGHTALPKESRDEANRWRDVFEFWRDAGITMRREVTVEDALPLLGDEGRDADWVVSLTSAALAQDLEYELAEIDCLIDSDGAHFGLPDPTELRFLVLHSHQSLATELQITTELHPAYSSESAEARAVRAWISVEGHLLVDQEPQSVLQKMADAAAYDATISGVLSDEQLTALREALESVGRDAWTRLTPEIGRALTIRAFRYRSGGKLEEIDAAPGSIYLPGSIDRETTGFWVAAAETPGIEWAARNYNTILRSKIKAPGGLGAQRFLSLLGCETTPRVVPHRELQRHYKREASLGLKHYPNCGSAGRAEYLRAARAAWTLDDYESPDLQAVVEDIASEKHARERRKRASALLQTLGRAWRELEEFATVSVARGYDGWHRLGSTEAFWIWRLSDVEWLDNIKSVPCAPRNLRVRSATNVALQGEDYEYFIHREVPFKREQVLSAIGVAGEPGTADLIESLHALRQNGESPEDSSTSACALYRALAQRLALRGTQSRERQMVQSAFAHSDGLINTGKAWMQPAQVLAGPPIFGSRRHFVPAIAGTDEFWTVVRVLRPSANECANVLAEIARKGPPSQADQAVVLETLRELEDLSHRGQLGDHVKKKLAKLPLWTTQDWSGKRPIYVASSPVVAEGLGDQIPVWLPGGDVGQFVNLIPLLRLSTVNDADLTLAPEVASVEAEEATHLFASAMRLLRDDLARSDPRLSSALRFAWDEVEQLSVHQADQIPVAVSGPLSEPMQILVSAYIDWPAKRLLLTDPERLASQTSGGRAVATLFEADPRQVTQAWSAQVQEAQFTTQDQAMVLALEQEKSDLLRREEALDKLTEIQGLGKATARAKKKATAKKVGSSSSERGSKGGTSTVDPDPRVLVDPDSLILRDKSGAIVGSSSDGKSPKPSIKKRTRLKDPSPQGSGGGGGGSSKFRSYTDKQKEKIALDLIRKVLQSDENKIRDIREQCNVGADAVDDMRRFYEFKVYAEAEPKQITLQPSQILRAIESPDFFLVVVSGVEMGSAQTKVRIIANPTSVLEATESSKVTWSGIQDAPALEYYFDTSAD